MLHHDHQPLGLPTQKCNSAQQFRKTLVLISKICLTIFIYNFPALKTASTSTSNRFSTSIRNRCSKISRKSMRKAGFSIRKKLMIFAAPSLDALTVSMTRLALSKVINALPGLSPIMDRTKRPTRKLVKILGSI